MREIMNMPVVQNLMNNPEIMRNLIMNNPQMREIIDRNPELAHVLNDPGTLRQTLEAARNPELMREMMRNTDRAMSNIESSPEGFNMLRRMYETVQEPFLNATSMTGNAGNETANPFTALLGNQAGNQARDGSTNPSTTNSDTTGSPAPNTNPLPNPWASGGTGGAPPNTARSNPLGDARPQTPAGLGGLGLPGFESMLGAMQDTNSLNQMMQNPAISQMMQNPAISQMMQSLLSNPQYMNQILGLNPQTRNVLDSNSQLREMMQNPEFLRQLTSPETMQVCLFSLPLFSHAFAQCVSLYPSLPPSHLEPAILFLLVEYLYLFLHPPPIEHLHSCKSTRHAGLELPIVKFFPQMLTLQQSLLAQLGRSQSPQEPGQTGLGAGNIFLVIVVSKAMRKILHVECLAVFYILLRLPSGAPNNMGGLEMLMNMFGGLGAGSLATPRSDVGLFSASGTIICHPIVTTSRNGFLRYSRKYTGFNCHCGNVHAAVERLLGNSGQ
ncbi:hypothetical protein Patl1_29262 [Pistacia atlantica]|uniref:Uncharacterized protein n=1 Tax=Pistacia atlantica TaxID=434234 RepID=A0ACC1BBS2_9ROSI|nr:hypothetical protein Patl1_29262 [Pistacia atlantica]